MGGNEEIESKYVVFGCLIPVFISFLFYLLLMAFSLDDALSEFWAKVFVRFPLYVNVIDFSPYKFEFFFLFFFSLISIPVSMLYWWRVVPSGFRGWLYRSSGKFVVKLVLSVIFLALIFVGSWFISVESLSDRRAGFFRYSFENPVLYYTLFIFPVSLVSWFSAGAAKFAYFKYKNTY